MMGQHRGPNMVSLKGLAPLAIDSLRFRGELFVTRNPCATGYS